jgi:AcrR family transcriptional regulator
VAQSVTDESVFDAVLTVLSQRGYVGATTRSIATAAGVNEVTLFRRYGDKRGLVMAAIHADIGRFVAGDLLPSGDLEADLIRVVEYYTRIYEHRDGLVATLVLEGSRNDEVAALISEPLAAMTRLGDLIAHYQRADRMVDEAAGYAAQALLAPVLMTSVLRRIAPTQAPAPDAATIVKRFLDGHGVAKAPSRRRR